MNMYEQIHMDGNYSVTADELDVSETRKIVVLRITQTEGGLTGICMFFQSKADLFRFSNEIARASANLRTSEPDGPVADSVDGYKVTAEEAVEEEEDGPICPCCNGSGEGLHEGTTCQECGGKGRLPTDTELAAAEEAEARAEDAAEDRREALHG
jgi:hypothetical protein